MHWVFYFGRPGRHDQNEGNLYCVLHLSQMNAIASMLGSSKMVLRLCVTIYAVGGNTAIGLARCDFHIPRASMACGTPPRTSMACGTLSRQMCNTTHLMLMQPSQLAHISRCTSNWAQSWLGVTQLGPKSVSLYDIGPCTPFRPDHSWAL